MRKQSETKNHLCSSSYLMHSFGIYWSHRFFFKIAICTNTLDVHDLKKIFQLELLLMKGDIRSGYEIPYFVCD